MFQWLKNFTGPAAEPAKPECGFVSGVWGKHDVTLCAHGATKRTGCAALACPIRAAQRAELPQGHQGPESPPKGPEAAPLAPGITVRRPPPLRRVGGDHE